MTTSRSYRLPSMCRIPKEMSFAFTVAS